MKDSERFKNASKNPLRIISGEYNFRKGINNDLARERYESSCGGCEFFKEEVNEMLQRTDKHISELTNRYCAKCGCILALKLRLKNEICPIGKW